MTANNSYWPGSPVEGLTDGFGSRLSFYSGAQALTRAFSKTDLLGKEIGRARGWRNRGLRVGFANDKLGLSL